MNDAVEVKQDVLEDMVAHARAEVPNECCGILIGTGHVVERSARARNLVTSPTRYLIDPVDHFAAIRNARESGREVVGFYHSHPASSPVPSETDRDNASYPGCWYLIVSPGGPDGPAEVRAFKLHDSGNFHAIRLVPIR